MVICSGCIAQALILLLIANGAPVLLNNFLGRRYAWPVDGGGNCADGRPCLGNSKTWRGLLAAVIAAGAAGAMVDVGLGLGLTFGALAMLGDLLASFIKRRIGYAVSGRARGLDTLPETLLPIWLLRQSLDLGYADMALTALLFFLAEEWLSPLLYKWHLRKRPY